MQSEIHDLISFKQTLKQMGMINDSSSVNNEFVLDLKKNNK